MGVDEVIDEERSDSSELDRSVTLGDLIDEYGEEAVKRGISYMASLKEADRQYRDANSGDYREGIESSLGEVRTEEGEEAVSNWEKEMKNRGIGLDE